MKIVNTTSIKRKIYLLLLLAWVGMGTTSCTYKYYSPGSGSFATGTTTTYCQGAAASAHAFNYTPATCSGTGTTSTGVSCTIQWYYNTTGTTSIPGSTALGSPAVFTSVTSGTGTRNYTPLTTTAGTFYYFAYISWTVNCSGSYTTPTQMITINASPGPISGPSSTCPGSTITLTDTPPGGTWSSSSGSVASISSMGVVTGLSPGTSVISYSGCGSPATQTITVNSLPPAITGTYSVCAGGGTTDLADASPGGGTWSSGSPLIASVSGSTGVVTGISGGSALITFTATTNCSITAPVYVISAPAPFSTSAECQGATTTLSDAIPGGTWSSGNTAVATVDPVTGVVTGISSSIAGGISLISYTNSCGTVSAANAVKPLPSPIAGRDSVCALSTTLLTDSYSGGTWSSSDPAIATLAGGSIYGVSAGAATITYTLPTGCFITTPFTVVAIPVAFTGPSHTCPGATISLVEPGGGGGTWTSDNTSVALVGAATGIVTGVKADTVTIVYTLPVGCSNSEVITVNPLPAPISGTISTCSGSPDSLADDSLGGAWSTSSASIATVSATGMLTTLSAGTVTITYTLPTSCIATASESVLALPAPTISYDGSLNTFSTQNGYTGYQWFISPTGTGFDSIIGANSYHLAALYNEYYTVEVTDNNHCRARAVPFHMVNVGVSTIGNIGTIKIDPNPVSDIIHIIAQVEVRAVISDMNGKAIMTQPAAKEMDVSRLAAGVYLVTLYDESGQRIYTQKLMKQ